MGFLIPVLSLLVMLAVSAWAQESPAPKARVIEEIVVTAQKRAEDVREVPVSMSVFDENFIRQEGITDYRDVSLYSPSTKIDVNSLFPDIRMRGFGSPLANKGFEQQVGLVLDGIPYGRDHYFQGPIFDLERVEVLRGPQGTLFGKNTTAGVFNVVTKNPTDELGGSIDLELGESDRRRFEGAIGGPIVKGWLNFRIAALDDERDPYVENTTSKWISTAEKGGHERERKAVRAKLGLPNLAGASAVVGYEHVETELHGAGWEFFSPIPPGLQNFFRQYDPDTDFVPDNYRGSVDAADYADITIDTIVANLHYDLATWDLDAVAGYSKLKFRAENDADFTPAPLFTTTPLKDDNPSTTFELRASSPTLRGFLGLERLFGVGLGESDVLAGFFFQRRELTNSELTIRIGVPALAQYIVAQGLPLSSVPGAPLGTNVVVPSGFFPGLVLGPDFRLGAIDTSAATEATSQYFDQTSDTFAGFTHLKWRFTDRWTLESGLRFTSEKKDGTIRRAFTEGTGLAAMLVAGMSEFNTQASLSEFAFTPKVVLKYDWTDDIGFYGFYAKGFKAGGFNEQSSNGSADGLVFGPEAATDFELGSKMRLFDGTAAVNLGLFRETVSDLQVLTLEPPQLIARAVNAGKARSQGVELDATWLPSSWLTTTGSVGYIDAKFLEFPNGSCPQDRPNIDGDGQPLCDLSDQPLARTPRWTVTLTESVRWPLARIVPGIPAFASKVDLLGSLTTQYRDVQFLDEDDDPRTRQPSFFRLNGMIGFGDTDRGWSAGVSVENLTDVATSARIRELTFGPGKFVQTLDPPRLVFGWARYSF